MNEGDYFGSVSVPPDEEDNDAANDLTFGDIGDVKAGDDLSETLWKPNHRNLSTAIEAEKERFRTQQEFPSQSPGSFPSPVQAAGNDQLKLNSLHPSVDARSSTAASSRAIQSINSHGHSVSQSSRLQPSPATQIPRENYELQLGINQTFQPAFSDNSHQSDVSAGQSVRMNAPIQQPLSNSGAGTGTLPGSSSLPLVGTPSSTNTPTVQFPLTQPKPPISQSPAQGLTRTGQSYQLTQRPLQEPLQTAQQFSKASHLIHPTLGTSLSPDDYERSVILLYEQQTRDLLARHQETAAAQLREALAAQQAGVTFDRAKFDSHQNTTRQLIMSEHYARVRQLRLQLWQRNQQQQDQHHHHQYQQQQHPQQYQHQRQELSQQQRNQLRLAEQQQQHHDVPQCQQEGDVRVEQTSQQHQLRQREMDPQPIDNQGYAEGPSPKTSASSQLPFSTSTHDQNPASHTERQRGHDNSELQHLEDVRQVELPISSTPQLRSKDKVNSAASNPSDSMRQAPLVQDAERSHASARRIDHSEDLLRRDTTTFVECMGSPEHLHQVQLTPVGEKILAPVLKSPENNSNNRTTENGSERGDQLWNENGQYNIPAEPTFSGRQSPSHCNDSASPLPKNATSPLFGRPGARSDLEGVRKYKSTSDGPQCDRTSTEGLYSQSQPNQPNGKDENSFHHSDQNKHSNILSTASYSFANQTPHGNMTASSTLRKKSITPDTNSNGCLRNTNTVTVGESSRIDGGSMRSGLQGELLSNIGTVQSDLLNDVDGEGTRNQSNFHESDAIHKSRRTLASSNGALVPERQRADARSTLQRRNAHIAGEANTAAPPEVFPDRIRRLHDQRLESMTDRDQELVFRVHLRQLESSVMYKDDYYNAVIKKKEKYGAANVFSDLANTVRTIRNHTRERGREGTRNKSRRNRHQNDQNSNTHAPQQEHKIKALANALGTVQSWNPRAPRRVMDFGKLGRDGSELSSKPSLQEDVSVHVRHEIEKGYDLIAGIHDICRGESTESIEAQILSLIETLHLDDRNDSCDFGTDTSQRSSQFFAALVVTAKGRRYLGSVAELLDVTERFRLAQGLIENLAALIFVTQNIERQCSESEDMVLLKILLEVVQSPEMGGEEALSLLEYFVTSHVPHKDAMLTTFQSATGAELVFAVMQRVLRAEYKNELDEEELSRSNVGLFAVSFMDNLADICREAESRKRIWDVVASLDGLLGDHARRRYRRDLAHLLRSGEIPSPPRIRAM